MKVDIHIHSNNKIDSCTSNNLIYTSKSFTTSHALYIYIYIYIEREREREGGRERERGRESTRHNT